MKARCYSCGKKPAKHPSDRPMFCSHRCGYYHAVVTLMDWFWCEKHGEWWHRGYGCNGCDEEKHSAPASPEIKE